jgi:hypothetical protein
VIAAARVGVLVLIAAAAVWALAPAPLGDVGAGGAKDHHVCPMHPGVAAPAPGRCPICSMALERVGPAVPGPMQAESFVSYGVAPVHRRTLAATAELPAWLDEQGGVTAVLFTDELRDLGSKERGTFFAARAPGAARPIERAAAPSVPWRGSTWLVRFRFRSGGSPPGLPGGASGWVELPAGGRRALVVASSAVLHAGTEPYLLVLTPGRRTYRRQPIATGRLASGYTVVVSGASERELVVGVNAFSLDADAQLRAQRGAASEGIAR